MKIQIINKCSPFSYVCLRRTCRFADEFCEHNRKQLRVYCPNDEFYVGLHQQQNKSFSVSMKARIKWVKIPLTLDNMSKINKALSGFIFAEFFLRYYGEENYENAMDYFLKAVPEFKVSFLECYRLTVEQVERVMANKWKIGGVRLQCQLEMWKILKIDAIRKMDPLNCHWQPEDNNLTEQDIVQLARGKKRMELYPEFLSTSSYLKVLKAIVQNWKIDGQFPIRFIISWRNEKGYMEANISSLYSEIMDTEAFYMGSFHTGTRSKTIRDIWIKMKDNGKDWQLTIITRVYLAHGKKTYIEFKFKSGVSRAELYNQLIKVLEKSYHYFIFDYSILYEAYHVTKNLEKFKEAFTNIVPLSPQIDRLV